MPKPRTESATNARSGRQFAHSLLMVRPAAFGFNPETAGSNAFQRDARRLTPAEVQARARQEFDAAAGTLQLAGVDVLVVEDTPEPVTPDAVFPNNWISTHRDGTVVTFPMFSPVRRGEVRADIIDLMRQRFSVERHWALEPHAAAGKFLEGTGSMVLDRRNRVAFACLSPRTDEGLVREFCRQRNYDPFVFSACDRNGVPLYHTNVLMSLLDDLAIVCLATIADTGIRDRLWHLLVDGGRVVIEIDEDQMAGFAANVLQIGRRGRRPVVALSTTAGKALGPAALELLAAGSDLVQLDIPTIEYCGGGSVRCMLAEIFLPVRQGDSR